MRADTLESSSNGILCVFLLSRDYFLWFTFGLVLLTYLDANEVKRAVVMSEVTLGESNTEDEEVKELAENEAANESPECAASDRTASTASTDDVVEVDAAPMNDSGFSTNESPDRDVQKYDNEDTKVTSMNIASRSSMKGELKKRLSTKDKPAPQPPTEQAPWQESTDAIKPVPAERKKKKEREEKAKEEREAEEKDADESVVDERERKISFKESLERKLSAKKGPGDGVKGICDDVMFWVLVAMTFL